MQTNISIIYSKKIKIIVVVVLKRLFNTFFFCLIINSLSRISICHLIVDREDLDIYRTRSSTVLICWSLTKEICCVCETKSLIEDKLFALVYWHIFSQRTLNTWHHSGQALAVRQKGTENYTPECTQMQFFQLGAKINLEFWKYENFFSSWKIALMFNTSTGTFFNFRNWIKVKSNIPWTRRRENNNVTYKIK